MIAVPEQRCFIYAGTVLKSTIYITINRWLHDISFGFDTCLVNCHFWRSLGVKSSARSAKNWRTRAGLCLCCFSKAISIEPRPQKKRQLENETARKNSNCLTFVAQLICDRKIKTRGKNQLACSISSNFFVYLVYNISFFNRSMRVKPWDTLKKLHCKKTILALHVFYYDCYNISAAAELSLAMVTSFFAWPMTRTENYGHNGLLSSFDMALILFRYLERIRLFQQPECAEMKTSSV